MEITKKNVYITDEEIEEKYESLSRALDVIEDLTDLEFFSWKGKVYDYYGNDTKVLVTNLK